MKGFKFQPVAWATGLLALLVALMTVNEATHILPESWTPYIGAAIALLSLLLGKAVKDRVTPLAMPRAADGRALVPSPPAKVPPGTPHSKLAADDPHPPGY